MECNCQQPVLECGLESNVDKERLYLTCFLHSELYEMPSLSNGAHKPFCGNYLLKLTTKVGFGLKAIQPRHIKHLLTQ